jgi:hypothetical protein
MCYDNPGAGGLLRSSTSCGAVLQVPIHPSAGLDTPVIPTLQEANKRRKKITPAKVGKEMKESL